MKLLSSIRKAALPLAALLLAGTSAALAQSGGVTIGASAPADASAALDIVSTSKGLLPPRLTQSQVAAIVNPATGLLVFQTDNTPDYYYNAGTPALPRWQPLVSLTASSPLAGSGTAASPLSIATATGTTTGALTGANFTTFNNKLGTASNGLTATGTNVALGGLLTAATNLATGTNTFAITQDASPLLTTTDINTLSTNPQGGNIAGSSFQSFTAGVTGNLTNVELSISGSPNNVVGFGLRIYSGTGTSGTLLYSKGVSYVPNGSTFETQTFPVDAAVTSGQVYTISIVDSPNRVTWLYDNGNPYAGGGSSMDPINSDFRFRTVVRRVGSAVSNFPIFNTTGGKVGIGTTTPAYMLDVNGEIRCANLIQSSDVRLKQNIRPLGQALAAVQALRGVRYSFRQAEFKDKHLPAGEQLGFLAQEVEKVYPELVSTDAQGYKAVNYSQLTPVLLEAIKEQQAQLEALKAANTVLRTTLDNKASASTLDEMQAALQSLRAEVQTLKAGASTASSK